MSGYGYGGGYSDSIFTPKTCGLVGSGLLILSLFLKFWEAKVPAFNLDYSYFLKEDFFAIIGVVVTIIFYLLVVWVEDKVYILFTFLAVAYDGYNMYKEYHKVADKVAEFNSYGLGVHIKISPEAGMIAYIIGIVALLIGLVAAYKE